jgi:hypothetical protein
MTVADELEAFVVAHRPHGLLHGDCGPVVGDAYTVWDLFRLRASCVRWMTLGGGGGGRVFFGRGQPTVPWKLTQP